MLVLLLHTGIPAARYVNGADPNRRLGSYRNLTDAFAAGAAGAPGIDPLLRDWNLLAGKSERGVTIHAVLYRHGLSDGLILFRLQGTSAYQHC